MKYSIGQQLWCATCEHRQHLMTCPDCGGSGVIRMILHDETTVSIGCGGCCRHAYGVPTGEVSYYDRKPSAELVIVSGVESRDGKTRYYFNTCRVADEENLFENREDAVALATKWAEKYNAEELDKIKNKEKDTKTWAWNASYHRKQIKDAQKSIEYHTAKLNVAALKAKEL